MNEGADILAASRDRAQISNGKYEDLDAEIAEMDRIISGKVA